MSWPSTRASLLQRIQTIDDPRAWHEFVELYAPVVYRYCRKRGLQDADAEDVVQEVMSNVRKYGATYRAERGRFRSWLGTVTSHLMRKQQKILARQGHAQSADSELPEFWEQIESQGEDPEWLEVFNARILEAAVKKIRPEFDHQQWFAFESVALRLCSDGSTERFVWVEDSDPAEVARQLNRTVGWIYKIKSQIMKRLSDEIAHLAEDLPWAGNR